MNTKPDERINKYEMIMIAAREARRLNSLARQTGRELKRRATTLAWERLLTDKIKFTYEPEPPVNEPPIIVESN